MCWYLFLAFVYIYVNHNYILLIGSIGWLTGFSWFSPRLVSRVMLEQDVIVNGLINNMKKQIKK